MARDPAGIAARSLDSGLACILMIETYIFGETHAGYEMGQQPGGPTSVVDALELKEGDEVEVHVADEREFAVSRKPGREELLKRLRAFRGRLPADFKFDRDEANGR